MIFFIIYIFIFLAIFWYIFKNNTSILSYYNIINTCFSNVSLVYSDTNITLYRGDKAGENFIFAMKNNSTAFSLSDITILFEKAEKLHIHSRILITDIPISSSVTTKKLKEYEIQIWSSEKLRNIKNSVTDGSSFSPLETSDTLDDTCEIDESPDDPIQDGTFNTHGIFSIFTDKTEHL